MFAAPPAREPLLGIYALSAEWRLLTDPVVEAGVARLKHLWWQDELRRLSAGSPSHPITRFIAALPGATAAAVEPLERALTAAAAEIAGVPLEHAADLAAHADALHGIPLRVAASVGGIRGDCAAVRECTAALAAAQYLARAVSDYRREARHGRISFAVDELLAAGIDNADLAADVPASHLYGYLQTLRQTATARFSIAARALPPSGRRDLRHLVVLAVLGEKHLHAGISPASADFHFTDLYNAWSAARRAAAAR